MKRQSEIFLDGEGDAWLARNRDRLGESDPVCDIIDHLGLKPTRALEIGCANGWRLQKLQRQHSCAIRGIDPSIEAVERAWSVDITLGTADNLLSANDEFDMVIFGFALYLCDRSDLFQIVSESDRVLRDGGNLIIHDFITPDAPYSTPYEHKAGVLSYHMDNAALWLAHPWYRKVAEQAFPQRSESVTVLRKDCGKGFPVK